MVYIGMHSCRSLAISIARDHGLRICSVHMLRALGPDIHLAVSTCTLNFTITPRVVLHDALHSDDQKEYRKCHDL